MDIEEATSEHVHMHMQTTFKELLEEYIVENVFWHEQDWNEFRPIATLFDSNIILLMPVFLAEDK
tara:strand:+ start:9371 stop:9565 length:195 start_codon:yes stop_codon:yes gene_type:complete